MEINPNDYYYELEHYTKNLILKFYIDYVMKLQQE